MNKFENLGKIVPTCDGPWKPNIKYDKLCIVFDKYYASYISIKPVPVGIPLSDEHFWQPLCVLDKQLLADYDRFKYEMMKYVKRINSQIGELILGLPDIVDKAVATYLEDISDDSAIAKYINNAVDEGMTKCHTKCVEYIDTQLTEKKTEWHDEWEEEWKKYADEAAESAMESCHEKCKEYVDDAIEKAIESCKSYTDEQLTNAVNLINAQISYIISLIEEYHNVKVNWAEIDNYTNNGPVEGYQDINDSDNTGTVIWGEDE